MFVLTVSLYELRTPRERPRRIRLLSILCSRGALHEVHNRVEYLSVLILDEICLNPSYDIQGGKCNRMMRP